MVLSLIAYTLIDVGFGVSWWVAKKTINGIYYGTQYIIYGPEKEPEEPKDNYQEIVLNALEKLKPSVEGLNTEQNIQEVN